MRRSQVGPNTFHLLLSVVLLVGLPGLSSAQRSDIPLQKGHTSAILEVRWSPNDQLLLTYSAGDGFLNVWKMPEGHLITTIEDSNIIIKGSDKRPLRAFAWSDDSRFIATGSENGTAQIWEAETGRLLWSTRIADEYVTGVGFSHDGKYLAAIASPEDEKHRLVLLDSTSGRLVKELGEIEQGFLTYYHDARLAFSDDNRQLLVGDIGGNITRWDLARGAMVDKKTLSVCNTTERRLPNAFSYSEDLSLAVARCGVKTNVIDTKTDSVVRQHSINNDFSSSIVLSRDKQLLAIGDSGSAKLLNLSNGTEVTIDFDLPIRCGCDFTRDNSLLAFEDYFDSETVEIVDVRTMQIVTRLEAHPGKIKALAFTPNGRFLASGGEDRIVRLWDAQTGSLVRALAGHTKGVRVVAFTPDGKLLVSASNDQTMKIWDVDTGRLVRSIQVTTQGIYGLSSIAFSPDGQRMVSTLGATVGLWDVSDWSFLRTFTTAESHTSGDMTYCCGSGAVVARFDARGQLIISAHEDGTIKVWNPKPARPQPLPGDEIVLILHTSERNGSFAFSPDEKLLVANNGSEPPRMWDWASGKPLRSLGEEAIYVHSIIFSPDSRLIATSSAGGHIILRSASSGKSVREFDGGSSSNDALAFSHDGTRLASGGDNQNIIMWDVKTGARLWHILPVRELYRATATEIAEQKQAAALSAAKEKIAERDTERLSHRVFIKFSHFGEVTDPGETRIAETGRPNTSLIRRDESEATGIWLRLHNNSRLPINLWTESIFLPTDEKCGYRTSTGKFFNGLCESSEFGIRFSVFDAKGNPVRYGFDFGGISMLPPNTSMLFSVPRELLREGRSIVVRYQFLNEDVKGKLVEYAKQRELRFTERNLVKQRGKRIKRG